MTTVSQLKKRVENLAAKEQAEGKMVIWFDDGITTKEDAYKTSGVSLDYPNVILLHIISPF